MSVYKAIQSVMDEIGCIAKGKTNEKQGYKFRGIEDAMKALQPALIKHGLVIVPRFKSKDIAERESKAGGAMVHIVAEMEYDFISVEDGSKHVVGPFLGEAMDTGDKACNKAMATAYKYMTFQTFCIPTEEQKDSDDDSPQIAGELKKVRDLYQQLSSEAQSLGLKWTPPQNNWSIEQFGVNGRELRARIADAKVGK